MPGSAPFVFYRGDTIGPILFNYSGLGSAIASIKMQVRPFRGSPIVTREFSSEAGDFTIAPDVFTWVAFVWDEPAGSYVYDLELTLANQTILTLVTGPFVITEDITQHPTPTP